MRNHEKMGIWREGMELAERAYRLTENLPTDERPLMGAGIRQAALAVPTQIAAGASQASPREFHHQLHRALSALAQLRTLCMVARNLGYVEREAMGIFLAKEEALARKLEAMSQVLGPEPSTSHGMGGEHASVA